MADQDEIVVTDLGASTYYFSPPLQVQAGDCIGWRHTGRGVFAFDTIGLSDGGSPVKFLFGDKKDVGETITFSGQQGRVYSWRINLVKTR